MTNITTYIFHAFLIGTFSYIYTVILTQPNMILGPLVKLIDPFFNKNAFLKWIYKPIIDCGYCNSGQLGLWLYLFTYWNEYNFFYHIGFICLSILTFKILNTKYGE